MNLNLSLEVLVYNVSVLFFQELLNPFYWSLKKIWNDKVCKICTPAPVLSVYIHIWRILPGFSMQSENMRPQWIDTFKSMSTKLAIISEYIWMKWFIMVLYNVLPLENFETFATLKHFSIGIVKNIFFVLPQPLLSRQGRSSCNKREINCKSAFKIVFFLNRTRLSHRKNKEDTRLRIFFFFYSSTLTTHSLFQNSLN